MVIETFEILGNMKGNLYLLKLIKLFSVYGLRGKKQKKPTVKLEFKKTIEK